MTPYLRKSDYLFLERYKLEKNDKDYFFLRFLIRQDTNLTGYSKKIEKIAKNFLAIFAPPGFPLGGAITGLMSQISKIWKVDWLTLL